MDVLANLASLLGFLALAFDSALMKSNLEQFSIAVHLVPVAYIHGDMALWNFQARNSHLCSVISRTVKERTFQIPDDRIPVEIIDAA